MEIASFLALGKIMTLSEVIPWKTLILLRVLIILKALSLLVESVFLLFRVLFPTLLVILFQIKPFLQFSLSPPHLLDHFFHLSFHVSVPPSGLSFLPIPPAFLLQFSPHSSSSPPHFLPPYRFPF